MRIASCLFLTFFALSHGAAYADATKLYLWQYQHSSRMEVYIDQNQAIYIDNRFREDQPHNSVSGQFPRWKVRNIRPEALLGLIEDLKAFDVFSWKSSYEPPPAEEGSMLLCSASWYLAIISDGVEFKSQGSCAEPEKLDDAVNAIFEFAQRYEDT